MARNRNQAAKTAKAVQPASQAGVVNTPKAEAKPAAVTKGGAKLDRSKQFYDVHSGGNVKFEQDGKLFNFEGNQVDLDGNLIKGKVAEKEPEPAAEVVDGAPVESAGTTTSDETTAGMTEDDLAALGGK